jgi:PTS system mannose-specific IIA component
MVGIVVVGHGRLGAEMVQALESVLGPVEAMEAVVTAATDRPEDISGRLRSAVARVDRGEGALILTDMLGDTATNQSLALAREEHGRVEVVAGINMPILIKLASVRHNMDARALAQFLKRYGQEHIFWATEPPVSRKQGAA